MRLPSERGRSGLDQSVCIYDQLGRLVLLMMPGAEQTWLSGREGMQCTVLYALYGTWGNEADAPWRIPLSWECSCCGRSSMHLPPSTPVQSHQRWQGQVSF